MDDYTTWMRLALQEAQKAYDKDEVPVGAVVVKEGRIIGKGHNLVERLQDPTAHAEMLAITAAANSLSSWRLDDSTLYATLEPCVMCTGAILLARVSMIVYGTRDRRYGACGTVLDLASHDSLDIRVKVIGGILEDQCAALLKSFFMGLRQRDM
jgi:tRNA(adenine34) deaminase